MHAKEADRLVTEILDYINPCFDILNALQDQVAKDVQEKSKEANKKEDKKPSLLSAVTKVLTHSC